jgi:hypothetical protein
LLAITAALFATRALTRSGDLRFAPTKTSSLWAVLGLLCVTAWAVGTWLPWQKQVLTVTVKGTTKSFPYPPCCSLSNQPAQWAVQAIVVAAFLGMACLMAACLRSAPTASGILLAACIFSAGDVITLLWDKPYTLAQLAPGLHTTEDQLSQVNAVVAMHHMTGAWTTSAASLGLLLLAVARGVQAASTTSRPVAAAARG